MKRTAPLLLVGLAPVLALCALGTAFGARDLPNNTANYLSVAASPTDGAGAGQFTMFCFASNDVGTNSDYAMSLGDTGANNSWAAITIPGATAACRYTEDSVASGARNADSDCSTVAATWIPMCGGRGGDSYRFAAVAGVYSSASANTVTYAVGELDSIGIGVDKDSTPSQAWDGPIGRCVYYSTQLTSPQLRALGYGVDPRRIQRASLVLDYRLCGARTDEPNSLRATYNLATTGTVNAIARPPYRGIVGRRPVTPTIRLDAMDVDSVGTATDNTAVSSWTNRGSANGAFAQATGSKQPTWRRSIARNGLPSVSFDGTSDILSYGSAILTGTSGEVWAVFELPNTASAAAHQILAESDTATATTFVKISDRTSANNNFSIAQQEAADTADNVRGATATATGQTYIVRWVSTGTAWSIYVWSTALETPTVVSGANSGDLWGDCTGLDNCTVGGVTDSTGDLGWTEMYLHELLVFENVNLTGPQAWDYALTLGAKWFAGN